MNWCRKACRLTAYIIDFVHTFMSAGANLPPLTMWPHVFEPSWMLQESQPVQTPGFCIEVVHQVLHSLLKETRHVWFPRLWGLYCTGREMTPWMKTLAPKHVALRLVLGTHRLERTGSRRLTSGRHTHDPQT